MIMINDTKKAAALMLHIFNLPLCGPTKQIELLAEALVSYDYRSAAIHNCILALSSGTICIKSREPLSHPSNYVITTFNLFRNILQISIAPYKMARKIRLT